MNLSQIERKFKELETKENYVRYFYNPVANKVSGVSSIPTSQSSNATIKKI